MSITQGKPTLAEKGQALGLRAITLAGGLGAMKNPRLRARVAGILHRGARQGFRVQTVAGRAFERRHADRAARPAAAPSRREFDLTPSEDQQMIRDAARELATDGMRPVAAEADESRDVPPQLRRQAAEMGLALLGVPTQLGGVAEERSAVTGVLVLEELARGDLGLAAALMAPAAVATALASYGDGDQQATFLPAFTDEGSPASGALALMEPQPLSDPLTPRTTAHRDGEDYVLDGVKALVPGARTADLFIVSAMLDDATQLFIVEPGTLGLATTDDPAMGMRAAHTGALHLDDVRVPGSHLLGTAEDHLDAVRRGRLAWSAAAVGACQAVLDNLREYTTQRIAFGEPIAHRQAVAFTVADVAIELDALRLVVWRAAAQLDAGRDASASIAHARSLTARYATETGSRAVQMLGGHGFVKEFDNERWYRDLRGAGLLEGALLV